MSNEEKKKEFINPIDEDKISENPHNLPYAHTVGGFQIKPIDKGKVKARALTAMEEQTQSQLNQIKEQIDVLARQAKEIQKRVEVSQWIYMSEMGFEPLSGQTYHLYKKDNGKHVLSIIGPNEWGKKECPFSEFVSSVRMLADHTWQILT